MLVLIGLGRPADTGAATETSAPTPTGSVVDLTVPSAALGRPVAVSVYLPPGYPLPGVNYPVLYLLHGLPGSGPEMFADLHLENELDNLIGADEIQPMLVVAPSDGPGPDTDTEWVNSTVIAADRWGTFVRQDLVSYIDANYATCTDRSARSIGGPSMGGFGAINAALADPAEFGAVTLWSAYFVANTPLVDGPVGSPSWLRASPLYSLSAHLVALRDDPVRLSFYVSSSDKFAPQSVAFARLLRREGLPHRFSLYAGVHGYALWSEYLASELTWLSAGEHC